MGRLYKVNEDYFECIDTEIKAYMLGFIVADGCILEGKGNRQDFMSIGIHIDDREILDKLVSEISSDGSVSVVHAPSMRKNGHSAQARWKIVSDKLVGDLKKLGVRHRKTVEGLVFPSLGSLTPHFIRGFFDGDGGITVNEVKNRYTRKTSYYIPNPFQEKLRKRAYFCSTDSDFLDAIFEHLPKLEGKVQKCKQRNCWVYNIEHQHDVLKLYEYLYKGSTFYLERKFSKFNMTIKSQASDEEGLETT